MCVKTTGLRPKKGGMKTDRAETENGCRTAMKEEEKLAAKGSKPHKEIQREVAFRKSGIGSVADQRKE